MDSQPQHLSRLQEEQAKAIADTDTQIAQVEKYKDDYKTLQDKLKTLPDQMSHDVMVQFGKLAFMPGKVVHTNEILVLLGDNWFAERTAKQAHDIAGRRIEELNKQVKNLKEQRKLLVPRADFTSEMHSQLKGQGDVKEIVEEYDAEKEKLWDAQHAQNVRRERQKERDWRLRASDTGQPDTDVENKVHMEREEVEGVDDNLWARLDALERVEAERGEMDSDYSEAEENEVEPQRKQLESKEQMSNAQENLPGAKVLRWKDEANICSAGADNDVSQPVDSDDDDDSSSGDNDGDDDSDEDVPRKPAMKTIRFSHTDISSAEPHRVGPSGDATIESPADIYKLFSPPSILKKSTLQPESVAAEQAESQSTQVARKKKTHKAPEMETKIAASPPEESVETRYAAADRTSSLKAFPGQVVETSFVTKRDSTDKVKDTTASSTAPRRVSKFKAARMARQGDLK